MAFPLNTSPAQLVLLSSLPSIPSTSLRVRLVGRVRGLDASRGVVLLEDDDHGLVVHLKEAVGTREAYMPRLKDLLMLTGDLETVVDANPPPVQVLPGEKIDVYETVVLNATLVKHEEGLDLHRWREAVRATQMS